MLPYILLIIALIFGGYQFKKYQDLKLSYSQLDKKYKALSNNSKVNVQDDATKFLNAFYTYDDRPKKENINGLTTKKLQSTLFQTYEVIDIDFEIPKALKYKSQIENVTIYHARDEYDTHAKVLATFDSIITLNKEKNHTKSISELELQLKNKKWIVTQYKVLNDVYDFQGN